jgi:predicted transcriptional regulator
VALIRLAAVLAQPVGGYLIASSIMLLNSLQFSKRERIEIITEILKDVGGGVTAKTRLMYKSNLDTRALKKYLDFMTEMDLLRAERDHFGHSSYHLTEKGKRLLIRYSELEAMLARPPATLVVSDPPQF